MHNSFGRKMMGIDPKLILLLVVSLASSLAEESDAAAKPLPVVMWHGMGKK